MGSAQNDNITRILATWHELAQVECFYVTSLSLVASVKINKLILPQVTAKLWCHRPAYNNMYYHFQFDKLSTGKTKQNSSIYHIQSVE